ncbi:MAG: hypothetical protein ACFFE4_22160 [Candidatus Thorarchaeota archaeon]
MSIVESQKTIIQANCPICGRKDYIIISETELEFAREQHSLITKAVSHPKEGHVLTLYIDGEGIVRRKYCFEIAEEKLKAMENRLPKNLNSIFEKMIQDSIESQ